MTDTGAPRLPARCSGPARGPPPARPSLGHGGPSLRPRSRFARSKRSLGVAFRPRSAHAADDPRAAAFDRLLMAAIIPPRRAPSALAPGPPNAPSGSPSEALRSPSRWAGKIRIPLHGIILPPSRAGRRTARYGSLPPDDGLLATACSHQKFPTANYLVCM